MLHEDSVVRVMAEELLLLMGKQEFPYMRWAAEAEPALRTRISEMMATIQAGAMPNPERWPSVEECTERLSAADEVVAIMAAQMLYHKQRDQGIALTAEVQEKMIQLLHDASHRPWFTRVAEESSSEGMRSGSER